MLINVTWGGRESKIDQKMSNIIGMASNIRQLSKERKEKWKEKLLNVIIKHSKIFPKKQPSSRGNPNKKTKFFFYFLTLIY